MPQLVKGQVGAFGVFCHNIERMFIHSVNIFRNVHTVHQGGGEDFRTPKDLLYCTSDVLRFSHSNPNF